MLSVMLSSVLQVCVYSFKGYVVLVQVLQAEEMDWETWETYQLYKHKTVNMQNDHIILLPACMYHIHISTMFS